MNEYLKRKNINAELSSKVFWIKLLFKLKGKELFKFYLK